LVKKTHPGQFWLIVKYRTGGMEVLKATLASGKEALPVFGSEDDARMFLELGTSGCWRVRETTADELTSALLGSCPGVDRVVLDPLPGPFAQTLMDLVSMGREAFMESYLKNEETSPLTTGSGHHRRRDGEITRRTTLERG
jgi:hypothetical protein